MKIFFKKNFNTLAILAVISISLPILNVIREKKLKISPLKINQQLEQLNIFEDIIKTFNMGQQRMISSLIWTQTLLVSDLESYKGEDLRSWMFIRFNTISILEPYFYKLYIFGGQYLSIIKDDAIGADYLMAKGLKIFPNDFLLNYYYGFNAYFELKDMKKAIKHFKKIMFYKETIEKLPSLASIVAKLKLEDNKSDLQSAFELIKVAYNKINNSKVKKAYYDRLYSIKAEIDLKCLNNKRKNCSYRDLDGDKYIIVNGKFKAKKKFIKFRLSKKPKKN